SSLCFFFFSSRRRHTRFKCDWSSDVCSSDLASGGWQTSPAPLHVPGPSQSSSGSTTPFPHAGQAGSVGSWTGALGGWMTASGARSEERRVGEGGGDRGWLYESRDRCCLNEIW